MSTTPVASDAYDIGITTGKVGWGLELLAMLPETPVRVQQELDLQRALGSALMAIKGYGAPEVGETYRRARELCKIQGDAQQCFQALWGLWRFHVVGQAVARAYAQRRLFGLKRGGDQPIHEIHLQAIVGQHDMNITPPRRASTIDKLLPEMICSRCSVASEIGFF